MNQLQSWNTGADHRCTDTVLDQNQIHEFKKLLLKQQRELMELQQTGGDAAAVVELDQTRVGRLSRMDALQGQAMSLERERRRDIQLQKIATALRRIEKDDYGYCTECGDEIAFKRLQFDPAASLCFNCANDKS
jgi:DnaK suppressor protein